MEFNLFDIIIASSSHSIPDIDKGTAVSSAYAYAVCSD